MALMAEQVWLPTALETEQVSLAVTTKQVPSLAVL
jgi:hypothetical protein